MTIEGSKNQLIQIEVKKTDPGQFLSDHDRCELTAVPALGPKGGATGKTIIICKDHGYPGLLVS